MGCDYYVHNIVGVRLIDVLPIQSREVEIPQFDEYTGKPKPSKKRTQTFIEFQGQEFHTVWELEEALNKAGIDTQWDHNREFDCCYVGITPGGMDSGEYARNSFQQIGDAFNEVQIVLQALGKPLPRVELHTLLYISC